MATLVFRFFNVSGPLQVPGNPYAAVVPAFLCEAMRDKAVTLHSGGTQCCCLTYVGSVAKVIADAVQRRETSPDPVNFAFGTWMNLFYLLDQLGVLLDVPIGLTHTVRPTTVTYRTPRLTAALCRICSKVLFRHATTLDSLNW